MDAAEDADVVLVMPVAAADVMSATAVGGEPVLPRDVARVLAGLAVATLAPAGPDIALASGAHAELRVPDTPGRAVTAQMPIADPTMGHLAAHPPSITVGIQQQTAGNVAIITWASRL